MIVYYQQQQTMPHLLHFVTHCCLGCSGYGVGYCFLAVRGTTTACAGFLVSQSGVSGGRGRIKEENGAFPNV